MRNLIFALSCLLMIGCSEYNYLEEVKEQVDSGVRNDSLFLGYYFGMERQDFFDHSWDLNRQQLVKQGQFNQTVEYVTYENGNEIQMNFYPHFDGDKVTYMPVIYTYPAWAPWNKDLWSDKLIIVVKNLLEKRDGVNFHLMKDQNGTPGFVSVSGNKRTIITIRDDQKVNVMHTDLYSLDDPYMPLVFNKIYE